MHLEKADIAIDDAKKTQYSFGGRHQYIDEQSCEVTKEKSVLNKNLEQIVKY